MQVDHNGTDAELVKIAGRLVFATSDSEMFTSVQDAAKTFLINQFKQREPQDYPEGMQPFGEVTIDFEQFAQKINEVQTVHTPGRLNNSDEGYTETVKAQVLLDLLMECVTP